MSVRILSGDCRDVLKTLPDESVHMVCTSPPYWGLRDYGTAKWEGGDPVCDHAHKRDRSNGTSTLMNDGRKAIGLQPDDKYTTPNSPYREVCGKCGARRIDSQIGLEATIDEYVETMVAVFREVRRVLRKDGTLWLNMGDSYTSTGETGRNDGGGPGRTLGKTQAPRNERRLKINHGLKPKDLCGIPWRVAFALQADGWYLRSDIIWSKPNPMPESVIDRPTKAHEYLFLLSKSANYYWDAEAIKEKAAQSVIDRANYNIGGRKYDDTRNDADMGSRKKFSDFLNGRNRRSVWEIATAPFPEAHFATFPPALVEPCIRAGTSERGCCAKCGAPWVREVEYFYDDTDRKPAPNKGKLGAFQERAANMTRDGFVPNREKKAKLKGWSPSCSCAAAVAPCTVLDPFGGAGTTGLVADRLGRNAVLVELNPEYVAMAEKRLRGDAPLFAEVAAE